MSITNYIKSLCSSSSKDKPIYFVTPFEEEYIRLSILIIILLLFHIVLTEINKTSEFGCNIFIMVNSGNSYHYKDSNYKYLGSVYPSDISKILKVLEYPISENVIKRISIITFGASDYNKGIKEEEYIFAYFKDYNLEFNENCTVIYGRSLCAPYFVDVYLI